MSNLSQPIRDIWTDAYKFHATFESMGNSVEEWDRACETAIALCKKHGNHPLAVGLLTEVYAWLDACRRPAAMEEARKEAGLEAIRQTSDRRTG